VVRADDLAEAEDQSAELILRPADGCGEHGVALKSGVVGIGADRVFGQDGLDGGIAVLLVLIRAQLLAVRLDVVVIYPRGRVHKLWEASALVEKDEEGNAGLLRQVACTAL
jgi:hypothetical protein